MISTSNPSPFFAGTISSLSIVPVRMPKGRRKRKRNSLQSPDDCGLRITDYGLALSASRWPSLGNLFFVIVILRNHSVPCCWCFLFYDYTQTPICSCLLLFLS